MATLRDICRMDRRTVGPTDAQAQTLPYLSLEDVESGSGRLLVEDPGDNRAIVESTTYLFDARHVLYGKLRPYLNKVALPDFEGRCTTELLPLLPTAVDREFLALLLRSPETVEVAMRERTGSRMPRANMADLMGMSVPLPPLPEQKRIAAALREQLDAAARLRTAAGRLHASAHAMRIAHIRQAFESPACLAAPTATIGEVSSLVVDGPHVTPEYVEAGVPFITVRDIVNRVLDFTDTSFITMEDHIAFSRRGKAELGDILYTKDGTLGIPCLVRGAREFSFFVSVALIKLRRDWVDPGYVAYVLESPAALSQVEQLGAGAGLKHMVLKSIRALVIPVLSLDAQRQLVRRLDTRLDEVSNLLRATSGLESLGEELPPALLHHSFAEDCGGVRKTGQSDAAGCGARVGQCEPS